MAPVGRLGDWWRCFCKHIQRVLRRGRRREQLLPPSQPCSGDVDCTIGSHRFYHWRTIYVLKHTRRRCCRHSCREGDVPSDLKTRSGKIPNLDVLIHVRSHRLPKTEIEHLWFERESESEIYLPPEGWRFCHRLYVLLIVVWEGKRLWPFRLPSNLGGSAISSKRRFILKEKKKKERGGRGVELTERKNKLGLNLKVLSVIASKRRSSL